MRKILMLIVTLALAATLHAADAVPYGHKDFVPTPEQPIGYRGDGTGVFPGATPVTEFWEGTPTPVKNKDGNIERWAASEDGKSKNIIWMSEMPSWSKSGVIVVGKKLFTKAEPNLLVCVDADSGKILWSKAANAWEIGGVEKNLAEKLQTMMEFTYSVEVDWTRVNLGAFPEVSKAYISKVQPRVLAALKELDPDCNYDEAAKKLVNDLEKWLPIVLAEKEKGKYLQFIIGEKKCNNPLADLIQARFNALAPKQIVNSRSRPWGINMGWCPSAPVSDGKLVYAHFGQDQVVAYDLDGNRVWACLLPRKFNKADMDHFPSPVLADGILLVNQDCAKLVGLDAKTGKTVWVTPGASTPGNYSVGTPKVLTLANGDEKLRVLVTESCKIVRISDGKIVGTHWEGRNDGGPSITNVGDIIIKGSCGDGHSAGLAFFRLTLKDKDTVEAVKVKQLNGGTSTYSAVVLGEDLQVHYPSGQDSVILAGKYFVRGIGRKHYGDYRLAQLLPDGNERALEARNALLIHWPRLPLTEKYAPEIYPLGRQWGQGHSDGPSAIAPVLFQWTDTETTAQGDRLYIRSNSHIYCIGPAVKGTPQDDPNVAAKIRSLTKVEELLPYLDKPSALERHEAALALGKLGVGAAPATAKLTTLVKEDFYEEIRAAAVIALDAIDPTGKPGTVVLQPVIAGIQGSRPCLARSLFILGPDRAAAVALPLLAKERPQHERRNAVRILCDAGVFNAQITEVLAKALQGDGDFMVTRTIAESIPSWPGDPAKVILLRDTLAKWSGNVPDEHGCHPGVLAYIANNLPEAERVPYLKVMSDARSRERGKAIEILRQLASGANKTLADAAAVELKAIETTKP